MWNLQYDSDFINDETVHIKALHQSNNCIFNIDFHHFLQPRLLPTNTGIGRISSESLPGMWYKAANGPEET